MVSFSTFLSAIAVLRVATCRAGDRPQCREPGGGPTFLHRASRRLVRLITLFAILPISLVAYSAECGDECQEKIVTSYFEKLSSIYRKGSTVADIEALFGSLDPSVRYEHLNYGANFTRDEWREAFVNNLERGAYNQADNHSIKVERYLHGKGFVAVSYSYGFKDAEGAWHAEGDQNLLALFKITGGRISSVKEYW
jgi:hypothetical protein